MLHYHSLLLIIFLLFRALDLLFKFFTSWCLRIVPALFLRDMYRALSVPPGYPPPKTPHYSPMLHNALVALGLAFLDDYKYRDLRVRQYFANTAKSWIEAECQKPNLSVVNALGVLASFHSSQGDQTLGYLYFGTLIFCVRWHISIHTLFDRYECPHGPGLCVSLPFLYFEPELILVFLKWASTLIVRNGSRMVSSTSPTCSTDNGPTGPPSPRTCVGRCTLAANSVYRYLEMGTRMSLCRMWTKTETNCLGSTSHLDWSHSPIT